MSWHEFVLRTCLSLHIGKVQRFCALLELCFSTLYSRHHPHKTQLKEHRFMKIKLTIEQADNGMIVRTDEDVKVIENTHSADEGRKDNLVHELGRMFFQQVNYVMYKETTSKVEVEIEINKTE